MNVTPSGDSDSHEIVVGRYRVIETLPKGFLFHKYLAYDPELSRRVAVRVLRETYNERYTEQFLKEARFLAAMRHPAVVAIFDLGFGQVDYQIAHYYVVEHFENSLERILTQGVTPRHYERLIEILIKVAEGLDYLHRRGYLHQDLRPDGILLDDGDQPHLCDFAFAASLTEVQDGGRDSICGTPPYMAPEQFDVNGRLGPHSDIWTVGVILYRVLTGHFPFWPKSLSHSEVRMLILNDDPVPPRVVNSAVPQQLEMICLKCLAKSASDRYADANSLAGELRNWLRSKDRADVPRVFISHSSADRAIVEREIVSLLERNGIQCWYSKNSISTAEHWERSILKGLQSCSWFLLVMSPNAANSEYVKDEVAWAIANRPQRIVPVMIQQCDPTNFHIRLARIQHVDFSTTPTQLQNELLSIFESATV